MQKFIKVAIDISSDGCCGDECEYNDSGAWCQLFGKETGEQERCEECTTGEIKEE